MRLGELPTAYIIYNIALGRRFSCGIRTDLFFYFIALFFTRPIYRSIGFGVRAFASGVGYRGHRCKAWFPVFPAKHSGIHSSWSFDGEVSVRTLQLSWTLFFFSFSFSLFLCLGLPRGEIWRASTKKKRSFTTPSQIPKPFGKKPRRK